MTIAQRPDDSKLLDQPNRYEPQTVVNDEGKVRQGYKLNTKRKLEYLAKLREGSRRGAAAEEVGVSRFTVLDEKKRDPEFAEACERAEMDANAHVEDALFQAAIAGNVTAAQVWLYNRDPNRWKDQRGRLQLELSGPGGGPIQSESRVDLAVSVLHLLRDNPDRLPTIVGQLENLVGLLPELTEGGMVAAAVDAMVDLEPDEAEVPRGNNREERAT